VVRLVPVAQAAQDGDRVVHAGLGHQDRLEAPGEGRVLSMFLRYSSSVVAPITCSSPRASAGLIMLPASMPTLCASTRADKSVQLIDEDDQLVTALPDLVNDPAHALLEVAAVAGPSDHSGELELYDTLALQHARDLAIGDTLRDAFGDRRLADPRLADQHRVILAPPGQHLDGLFDLAVATDHWVDPALAGQGGQVTAELIKRGGSGPATRSRRPA